MIISQIHFQICSMLYRFVHDRYYLRNADFAADGVH